MARSGPGTKPRYDAFLVVAPGLEAVAALELAGIGITPAGTETGGVSFRASKADLYAANLHLRTASRVLVRLAAFHAAAFWELEKQARRVPWDLVVAPGARVRFTVTSRKSRLSHQGAIAERLLAAITARVRDSAEGEKTGAQEFVVRLLHDTVTVSADSSGALLHQRGYRLATARAPLRETLAAAMLLGAGYDGSAPLVDPFMGSGTIPIEAAMMARRMAPGRSRRFAFEDWPTLNRPAWERLQAEARSRELPRAPASILGSDRDAGAVDAAKANAARAEVAEDIAFEGSALSTLRVQGRSGWLVTNPPYGVRVGVARDLRDLYARLGQMARTTLASWTVALLGADPSLTGQTGLEFREGWRSRNGGIPVRLLVREGGVSP